MSAPATVTAVCRSGEHAFSKPAVDQIMLIAGLGVEGDAHCGVTVKHRSRVAKDPTQPNLRQVHLIHHELIDELVGRGFRVAAGVMGENITTRGIDLLGLAKGALLHLGDQAVVEITGLRNPCKQLDAYQAGLMHAVLDRGPDGELIRRSGVMGVVLQGGCVAAGDPIHVTRPDGPHEKLERV